ncbi:MAG TPA: YIP1 family protein [Anaerolineaceae bacterium]|nr:YIP1 family protein [Anaerolineaceae bacterium]
MALNQNGNGSNKKRQALKTEWIFPLFTRPARTTTAIVAQEKSVWLTPLLILSVLVILAVVIGAPIKRNVIQMGSELPPDFQYYSPEMQEQFFAAQAQQTSPLFLYVFPLISGLLKVWAPWFLLSILMYLSLTLAGSRAGSIKSYNLVAWSMLPLAVRYLVQIPAMLFTKTVVSAPGFSGFIASDAAGISVYFRSLLGFIDIYFIFHIILLLIGSVPLSGLPRTKAWIATAVSVLIVLLLMAIPGLLSSALGGLSLRGGFYF